MIMRNPFAKPYTPGQWLLGSVCWTVVCVGSWVLVSNWTLEVPYNQKTPDEPAIFLSFIVAYSFIWWKALPGLRATETESSELQMLAFLWQVVLIAFQMIWLGLMLLLVAAPLFYNPETLNS